MPGLTEAQWADRRRQKIFAVAVLAELSSGATLPYVMIRHAREIRDKMLKEGTWLSA